MLRLPEFTLRRASTLQEAADILAGEPGVTRLVAGGTDLWPNMKRRLQPVDTVVAIGKIAQLRRIDISPSGELRIGATTLLSDIVNDADVRASYPALADAVQSISSPVLRNMGTLGGNLCLDTRCNYYNQGEEWRRSIDYCMKEGGSVCWVAPSSPRCWAISASDSAPILCAMGASVRLVSRAGERTIPLTQLYRDDGISYLTKRPDEILVEVIVPALGRRKAAFKKLRRRGSIDFAVLTIAVCLETTPSGTVSRADLFVGAVGSFPTRIQKAEKALLGRPLNVDSISEASNAAGQDSKPLDNTDFEAAWRAQMVRAYCTAALREAAGAVSTDFAGRDGG